LKERIETSGKKVPKTIFERTLKDGSKHGLMSNQSPSRCTPKSRSNLAVHA